MDAASNSLPSQIPQYFEGWNIMEEFARQMGTFWRSVEGASELVSVNSMVTGSQGY